MTTSRDDTPLCTAPTVSRGRRSRLGERNHRRRHTGHGRTNIGRLGLHAQLRQPFVSDRDRLMPDVILALLRIIFLGLVYLFVWQVARAIGSHLGISVKRQRKQGSRLLFVKSETQQGIEFEVNDVVVMGRSDEADYVLDDPYASEFHLRLVAQENGLMLHDLGSTNGTYVNGRRVSAPTPLRQGDTMQVGKTVLEVR